MPRRIAILGGGISGLTAAYELAHRGHREFILFESSGRLGGIVETVCQDGFVMECGPDSWVSEKPWARELAIDLGLEDQILPSNDEHRRTYLLEGDRLIPMPDGMRMMVPSDLAALESSPLFSSEAVKAYVREPGRAEEFKAFAEARNANEDESVADFVRRHFGDEVTRKVAGPLLAGVFGGDIERLSAQSTMPGFVKMEREHGSLVLGLQRETRATEKKPAVFTTLKGGLQTLIEAISVRLPAASVRLNESVLSLCRKGHGWQVVTPVERTDFDTVILATPVHVSRELLFPIDPELGRLLDIDATSAIVAAFAFNREVAPGMSIPKGFGFLAPQRAERVTGEPSLLACTFVDQKFPHRAPEGAVLLRAFYGGDAAAALMGEPNEAILNLACRQLARILGDLPQALTVVRRWPQSLPQYAVGHPNRVARIEARIAAIPGLYLTGNAYHGVGLPDLIRDGREIAARLLDTTA